MLSGATAAQSRMAFQVWLDNIFSLMTSTNPMVYYRGGIRENGLYHQMLGHEFDQITSLLSRATSQWGDDCNANNLSCGRLYYIRGRGSGATTVTNQIWGPFR